MQHIVTLIGAPGANALESRLVDAARIAIDTCGGEVGDFVWLSPGEAVDIPFDAGPIGRNGPDIREALAAAPIDVAIQPLAGRRKKLLISDMDSTIVANETLDDLAALAGVGEQVAAITLQSMRGEVDFVEALETRVAMLEGLPAAALEAAFGEVRLMPGADALVRTMRAGGAHTMLVSGGFTYFTKRVARLVGFDEQEANELEIREGRLTGRVVPPIINRDGKIDALKRIAAERGIDLSDTIAVGDGANDLGMVEAAGLGVAYHAKRIVAERAAVRIDHGNLTALLYIQGYHRDDFSC